MTEALRTIAAEIETRGRICFADVRRLERDILPDGIASREQAETLIALDRVAGRADRSWSEWFVAVMVDFVVWSERPTGVVNEEAARWLSDALDVPTPTRNARRLVNAIVAEAERVHESLVETQDEVALAA
ncbi:hypothetical protein [uncultured Alsobacter sp.]|uniref:hypothetical protein n=1 Tax=uncultured Alsobacter sp. TaxID=1748258 RepID=UPI0025DB3C39|nr:hypothetical protein [uncultured Alsobacter sp.]